MSEKIFNAIRKINPNAHMIIRGNDVDSCEIQWLENTTPISKEDIKAEMTELPTLKEEATAKENLKASAKAINAGYAIAQKTYRNLKELPDWDKPQFEEEKIVIKFECKELKVNA